MAGLEPATHHAAPIRDRDWLRLVGWPVQDRPGRVWG